MEKTSTFGRLLFLVKLRDLQPDSKHQHWEDNISFVPHKRHWTKFLAETETSTTRLSKREARKEQIRGCQRIGMQTFITQKIGQFLEKIQNISFVNYNFIRLLCLGKIGAGYFTKGPFAPLRHIHRPP